MLLKIVPISFHNCRVLGYRVADSQPCVWLLMFPVVFFFQVTAQETCDNGSEVEEAFGKLKIECENQGKNSKVAMLINCCSSNF